MNTLVIRLLFVVLVSVATPAAAQTPARTNGTERDPSSTIIAMERAALDRWSKGDPSGYLDIMAPDVSVFDAGTARRVDGIAAAKAHYEPIRGKVAIARYDLIEPMVQRIGNAAVLTFRFISYNTANAVTSRWNFTEVYRQTGGRWQIVQSHASYTLGRPPEKW